MSKFIKLTNMILNTKYIYKISIKPNKYYIYFKFNEINGFLWLFGGTGVGNISSYNANANTEIEVCETNHPIDYKIITEWIDKN